MEEQQTPFQAAIKPGLTMGLVALAVTYIAYFIDSSLLASGWFALISLVIFFGLIIYFGQQYRNEIGGYMTFGTAFNFSFIAILISGLVSLAGQILLFQVIDPSLPQVLADITFENSIKMLESFGQNPDALPAGTLEEMRKNTSSTFTLAGQIKNFGFALILYAIIALILAAILKKRDKSLDY
ncbi:MAG: DUF4199 domain-containing protein [Algoriphagus sp.]|jgi:hypothetical protein|uniref:DUF4199 domain-containing protein n=1 Tax=Algoriphagus sp. TaxID=1872435 RepID=UPI00272F1764|nr:DUF4199 domain-containing protein [Algoriphagus sp.]MDP2043439.1 DUF4199 domain-containing protein [Algoriphagus sp.]MDP3471824.1 DUF4199 domain-containing protein [Algoriphagus sp.]